MFYIIIFQKKICAFSQSYGIYLMNLGADETEIFSIILVFF